MSRLGLAFRAFMRVFRDPAFAEQVDRLAQGEAPPASPRQSTRSDALTLLSVLQREARLVDFLQESISGYDDAQIGAAARDVHRDCAAALERIFALRPVDARAEGAEVEVPAGFDASRIRLSGNVTGSPPFRGKLRHAGWEATRCQVPEWSGPEDAARLEKPACWIVAPSEVEV